MRNDIGSAKEQSSETFLQSPTGLTSRYELMLPHASKKFDMRDVSEPAIEPDAWLTVLGPRGQAHSVMIRLGRTWRQLLFWGIVTSGSSYLLIRAKEILAGLQTITALF